MVFVLTIAYTLSFLDRQILTLLVQPIRRDMAISDFQMSLLMGIAFGVFYAIMGLPISRLVDRKSRKWIIISGVVLWSLMTGACGMARNYFQLFLARVGIGVGEATLNPSAFSMVSDGFPEKRRPLATAFFHLGIPFGSGMALIVGGWIIDFVSQLDTAIVAKFFVTYAWQLTFLLVGIPGLLVALLVMTIVEPERRGLMRSNSGEASQQVPIRDVARFIRVRKLAYFAVFFGVGLKITLGYGSAAWTPTYFIRIFEWSPGEFGKIYGLISIVVGIASVLFCGLLANWHTARGRRDANINVVLIGYVIGIPFAIAAPLMPNAPLAVTMFMLSFFFNNWHVLTPAILLAITPNQMRGQVSAIYIFIVNMLGLGLGPSIVAGFTDFLFGSDMAVGKSLSLMAAILGPLGAIVLFTGLRAYRRALDDALEWEAEPATVSRNQSQ
jgi:MFS family permease